jgi:carbon monoxide dehydrogenase subunit G
MVFQWIAVKRMAYLRKEKETVEIAYSINKVWTAIPKVLTSLQWNIEQIDEAEHRVKAKTKGGHMSWSSVLLIDVVPVNENTTRVSVAAETPVTMITAIVDFGRTRRLIGIFFMELAEKLTG